MKLLSIALLMFLFLSCKENANKERYYLKNADSLTVTPLPMNLLPLDYTPHPSIEEKKLDTIIALLKKKCKVKHDTIYIGDAGIYLGKGIK